MYYAIEVNELESLRKKAKLSGIPHTDKTTIHELHYRLEHLQRFVQYQYGGSGGVTSISALLTPTEYVNNVTNYDTNEVEEDIDGIPIESVSEKMTQLERLIQSESDNIVHNSDDDEDIDGVPIDLSEYTIPVSSQPPPSYIP